MSSNNVISLMLSLESDKNEYRGLKDLLTILENIDKTADKTGTGGGTGGGTNNKINEIGNKVDDIISNLWSVNSSKSSDALVKQRVREQFINRADETFKSFVSNTTDTKWLDKLAANSKMDMPTFIEKIVLPSIRSYATTHILEPMEKFGGSTDKTRSKLADLEEFFFGSSGDKSSIFKKIITGSFGGIGGEEKYKTVITGLKQRETSRGDGGIAMREAPSGSLTNINGLLALAGKTSKEEVTRVESLFKDVKPIEIPQDVIGDIARFKAENDPHTKESILNSLFAKDGFFYDKHMGTGKNGIWTGGLGVSTDVNKRLIKAGLQKKDPISELLEEGGKYFKPASISGSTDILAAIEIKKAKEIRGDPTLIKSKEFLHSIFPQGTTKEIDESDMARILQEKITKVLENYSVKKENGYVGIAMEVGNSVELAKFLSDMGKRLEETFMITMENILGNKDIATVRPKKLTEEQTGTVANLMEEEIKSKKGKATTNDSTKLSNMVSNLLEFGMLTDKTAKDLIDSINELNKSIVDAKTKKDSLDVNSK